MSRLTRKQVDAWFPTLVRYAGILVIFYSIAVDHGNNAALIPAGLGMIGFKTVYGNRNGA